MTQKEALQILIDHAKADCKGCGTGIRSLPSQKEIERVRRAISILWNKAYNYEWKEIYW